MAAESQSFSKGSDSIPNHNCDVCNSKIVEVISYCTICCENLCQSCDVSHRGSKASRDHTILTVGNVPSGTTRTKPTLPFMFCDTHKTTLINIYCTTHDEVICPACKMTSHIACDTRDVTRHSARLDVEKQLKKIAKGLKDLTTRYDDLTKNRRIYESTVKTQIQKCLSNMHQIRHNINEKLDQLETKLSSEIRYIEENIEDEIHGHVTLASDILRQITDLDTTLSECQKTRENDVMFVGMKKVSSRLTENSNILENLQKNIYPIDVCFQPNDVLTDMIQQLQSLGTVDTNRPIYTGPNRPSVLNITVTDKQEMDVDSERVLGCTFMSDGQLVLACSNDGLKLFDKNFKFKSDLSSPALDVSAINDTDVIVTHGFIKQLQCVRVLPDMVVKKTLQMDRKCYGLDVYGDEIYATCHDTPGNGEVRVLNMDGVILRQLGVDNGTYMFTRPNCVKVNRDGSKVFVTDWDTGIVTCLNTQGHVIYQYSDRDLKTPVGMYVDGEDNLLVCGVNSHNVHVVRHDGGKEKVLLSGKDGIQHPRCISYRQRDGCLVVGLHKNAKTDKKFIIFKTRSTRAY